MTPDQISEMKGMYSKGVPIKAIARELATTPGTVRYHVKPISKKPVVYESELKDLARRAFKPGVFGLKKTARLINAELRKRGDVSRTVSGTLIRRWVNPIFQEQERRRSRNRAARQKAELHEDQIARGFRADPSDDEALFNKAIGVSKVATRHKDGLTPRWIYEKYKLGVCEVTGVKFVHEAYHPASPEIDRIVPGSRGGRYTPENCRMVCRAWNVIRSNHSDESTREVFKTVASGL